MLAREESGIWCLSDLVILDPAVGWKIDYTIAEVMIETMREGAVGNRFGPIQLIVGPVVNLSLPLLGSFWLGIGFVQGSPVPAEMPLSDAGGVVAMILQHFGEGEALGFENRCSQGTHDAMEVAPVVAPGEKGVS